MRGKNLHLEVVGAELLALTNDNLCFYNTRLPFPAADLSRRTIRSYNPVLNDTVSIAASTTPLTAVVRDNYNLVSCINFTS